MPTATSAFMSGAPRSREGTPLRKKRSPGPNITALVSTNCSSQLSRWPIVAMTQSCMPGIRCEPISSTNTGSVSASAIHTARRSAASSAAASASRAPSLTSAAGLAPKPAFCTAATRAAVGTPPASSTWARREARFTLAVTTPGTRCSTFSTRPTQAAQLMPSMSSSSASRRTA